MSTRIRYTEEFKRDAVAQVTDRGYSVKEVAERLGVCTKSLYDWKRKFHKPPKERNQEVANSAEIRRLKIELLRVTEERDILKKATAYFARDV
ncbi:MAG: transposase [Kordiimonadaceae bacterium]|jgi:transposase|nr:transposase [Kordiimonadaceae bacterium]